MRLGWTVEGGPTFGRQRSVAVKPVSRAHPRVEAWGEDEDEDEDEEDPWWPVTRLGVGLAAPRLGAPGWGNREEGAAAAAVGRGLGSHRGGATGGPGPLTV